MEKRLTSGRRAPTLQDVARHAGVSVATVSHVVNRTEKRVSAEVQARVEEAIRALGYRPNYVARALKTRVSRSIGVVVRDLLDPGCDLLLKGLAETASPLGIGLVLASSEGRWGSEAETVRQLLSRQADGLVVMSVSPRPDHLYEAATAGVPVVLIESAIDNPQVLSLLPDYAHGVRQALEHLWALGHRRIGFIAGAVATLARQEAFQAYQAFLREHDLVLPPSYVRTNASSTVGGYKAMQGLLQLATPPSAVLVADHWMLLGAFRALLTAGRRCPDDLALVGMGDAEWAEVIPPGITVIALPAQEMGREAGRRLLQAFEAGALAGGVVRLPARLIVRGSTVGAG
jgi:LacI family transcriptional regulator